MTVDHSHRTSGRSGLYVQLKRPKAGPRPVPDGRWSALNIAVEMRFRACLANGGHLPGSRLVVRTGDLNPLRVCERCGVPIAPRRRVVLGRQVEA